MIKAVFFDIDGTLVSLKTHRMAERDAESLVKLHEKGILVFLATGRHIEIVDNALFPVDGIINCNGTMAHLSIDGRQHSVLERQMFKKIYSHPFSREVGITLARICRENDFATVVFPEHEPFINLMDERMELGRSILKLPDMPVKDIVETAAVSDCYSFCPQIPRDRQDVFDVVKDEIFVTRWHPDFVDINPAGTSKAVALKHVAGYLGLDMSEIAAFGDGTNDAPMIEAAGTGVAMGNALPESKAVADIITDDVDDCGVTTALIRMGLI